MTDSAAYKDLLIEALQRIEAMEAQLALERQANEQARQTYEQFHEPVAIIGMGCRLPGGVNNPAEFWDLLVKGEDTSMDVPPNRWDIDALYDPDPSIPGKMYTRRGSFIEDPELFDPQFFNISPREAVSLDPQQRLLLEVTWEALESANIVPESLYGSQTGVFVGISNGEYISTALAAWNRDVLGRVDPYFGTGNAFSTASGRISYTLRLVGPNVAVDTACSSSLSAIYLACMSLRNGKCDLALAGGVNMIFTPAVHIAFSKARMLSPDGHCKTFDAAADGYLRGEGCGVILLKRLSDAQRDGDTILALVRGGAMNQDGASSGLTVPSGPSQQAVVRQALADARVKPEEVSYVEAHGTGTFLGDPIEAGALAQVFGPHHDESNPLYIGSVKTNIGHLESAAGISGVLKLILAMQHREIPRNLHFNQLNPNIPWDGLALHVPTEHMTWQAERRIAGISGFGFGGTNVHLVLEEPPEQPALSQRAPIADLPRVLSLSARSEQALRDMAASYADFLETSDPVFWPDICHTSHHHRALFRHRLALAAASPQEAAGALRAFAAGQRSSNLFSGQVSEIARPRLAFLFTGQGAQYADMGCDLYQAEPVFRQVLDECNALLGKIGDVTLLEALFPEVECKDLIHETAYTQPALFAIEVALGKLLESWGIQADVMIGHSIGEYAAACLAGIFSLEEGLRLVKARGALMSSLPHNGAMLSISATQAMVSDTFAELGRGTPPEEALAVSIAAINAPESVVVSGEKSTVEALQGILEQRGIRSEFLQVSHAFHSPLMDSILEPFGEIAASVTYHAPQQRLVSNLNGRIVGPEEMQSAGYWSEHIRQGVQFLDGIQTIQQLGTGVYLEIGPRPALIGLARQCLGDAARTASWIPTLRPGSADRYQLAACLAQLFVSGFEVSWEVFDQRSMPVNADLQKMLLPTYPFQRQRYWIADPEPGIDGASAAAQAQPHPLLGEQIDLAGTTGLFFENRLGARSPGYLADHRLFNRPVFPGAGFVEMAIAAGRAYFQKAQAIEITDARIEGPLVFDGSKTAQVQTAVLPDENGGATVSIFSRAYPQDRWQRHFTANLQAGSFPAPPDVPRLETLRDAEGNWQQPGHAGPSKPAFYLLRSVQGLEYGPAFQTMEKLRVFDVPGALSYCVDAKLAQPLEAQAGEYTWHPALLDGLLQPLAGSAADTHHLPLPLAFDRLTLHHLPDAPVTAMTAYLHLEDAGQADSGGQRVMIYLYDDNSMLVGSAESKMTIVDRAAFFRLLNQDFNTWFYHTGWQAIGPTEPLPAHSRMLENQADSQWLLCADGTGVAEHLALRLVADGGRVTLVSSGVPGTGLVETPGEDENITRYSLDPLDPVAWQRLAQTFKPSHLAPGHIVKGIVHLWNLPANLPLDRPVGEISKLQETGLASLLHLVQGFTHENGPRVPRLWLVTRGAWPVHESQRQLEPIQALPWGLGRVIAFEHNEYEIVSLDLDPDRQNPGRDASWLYEQLHGVVNEDMLALRDGQRWGLRVKPGWPRQAAVPPGDAYHLAIDEYGLFEFLHLEPMSRTAPGPDEVEIEVKAAGLNLRDVLNALGMLRQFAAELGIEQAENLPFGGECTGVVTAAGENAAGKFKVGDEVVAVMAIGSLASHVCVRLEAVAPKPQNLTFEEAATLPTASLTAYYGLHTLAGIQPGDRVLIHAAAGGVGQAAVQVAKRAGAEIFATASQGKWDFLHAQGIEHIYNSRTTDFASRILEDTGSKGVDIVFNSLAGEFIPASLATLAENGRFVEIGKLDVMTPEFFAKKRPDARYYLFDLIEVALKDPETIESVFHELVSLWEGGEITPLPYRVYAITEAEAAFRYMAQAQHIGKLVLVPPEPPVAVRPSETYWITGGLGGLGLQIASWLVYKGARHLLLSGRSGAANVEAQAGVAMLRELGAEVTVAACDVSDQAAVTALATALQTSPYPLAGVIHAAGIPGGGMIREHNWEDFSRQLLPKVQGSWNMHLATRDLPLDFFIVFSSISALVGSPGQSSYSASNLFMDMLIHARRASGLPGTSINWGPWAEVGMVPRMETHMQQGQLASGLAPFSNASARMAFEAVMERVIAPGPAAGERQTLLPGLGQVFVSDIDWQKFASFAPLLAASPVMSEVVTKDPAGGRQRGELLEKLKALPVAERKPYLFKAVQQELAAILNLPAVNIEPHQRLLDFGMDSLMAIEFKNSLEINLACNLPATIVFDYPTVGGVTDFLVDELLGLGEPGGNGAAERPQEDEPSGPDIAEDIPLDLLSDILDEVEVLGEDEAVQQLDDLGSLSVGTAEPADLEGGDL